MAASFGHEALVSLLIEAGASVNRRAIDGCTPLHAACIQGHLGCAQVLLVHGADARAELIDMTASLSYCNINHGTSAYDSSHDSDNGASPSPCPSVVKPGSGVTPLSLCHTKKHPHCVELLVAHLQALSFMPRTSYQESRTVQEHNTSRTLQDQHTRNLQEQHSTRNLGDQNSWNRGARPSPSPFVNTTNTTTTTTTTKSDNSAVTTIGSGIGISPSPGGITGTSPSTCASAATLGERWLSMLWAPPSDQEKDKGLDKDKDKNKDKKQDSTTVWGKERALIDRLVGGKVQRWSSQIDRLRYPSNGHDDNGDGGGSIGSGGGDGGGSNGGGSNINFTTPSQEPQSNISAPTRFDRELIVVDQDQRQSNIPVKPDWARSDLTGGFDRDLIEIDLDRCCFPDYRRGWKRDVLRLLTHILIGNNSGGISGGCSGNGDVGGGSSSDHRDNNGSNAGDVGGDANCDGDGINDETVGEYMCMGYKQGLLSLLAVVVEACFPVKSDRAQSNLPVKSDRAPSPHTQMTQALRVVYTLWTRCPPLQQYYHPSGNLTPSFSSSSSSFTSYSTLVLPLPPFPPPFGSLISPFYPPFLYYFLYYSLILFDVYYSLLYPPIFFPI